MKQASVTIVIYNPDQEVLFLSFAALIKKYQTDTNEVISVPATPLLLADEEALLNLISSKLHFQNHSQLTNITEETLPDEGLAYLCQTLEPDNNFSLRKLSPEPDISKIPKDRRYIILDIGPKNSVDMENIITFFDRHESEIVFWIDFSHDWLKNEIAYINHRHLFLFPDRAKTPLNILRDLNITSPPEWFEAEDNFLNPKTSTAQKSYLYYRYSQALAVASIYSLNLDEDNYSPIFDCSAWECADEKTYDLIHEMVHDWLESQVYTRQSVSKIVSNWSPFRKLSQIGRPAGFLKLNYVPDYADIESIIKEGTRLYPWLFVLVYRFEFDKRERLRICSAKLKEQFEKIAPPDSSLVITDLTKHLTKLVMSAKE